MRWYRKVFPRYSGKTFVSLSRGLFSRLAEPISSNRARRMVSVQKSSGDFSDSIPWYLNFIKKILPCIRVYLIHFRLSAKDTVLDTFLRSKLCRENIFTDMFWARKIRGFREEFLGEEIFRIPDKFYGTPLRSLRAAMKDQASRCWLGRRIFITLDTHSIAYIPASISRNMEPGWSSCVHTQMKRIRYVETSNETWTRCTTLF